MTTWIACSERLPEDGDRVLLHLEYTISGDQCQETILGFIQDGEIWTGDDYAGYTGWPTDAATLWMPIPEVLSGRDQPADATGEVTEMEKLSAILNPTKRTYHWLHPDTAHPIGYPQYSDRELAGAVRMLTGSEPGHESLVCAARDRIMYLSEIVEAARAAIAAALAERKGNT